MTSCEVCLEIKEPCVRCRTESERKALWLDLSASEKSLCLAYSRALKMDLKPNKSLIDAISEIHRKYPEFSMAVVP